MVNTNVTCKGSGNGSINLSVTGGVTPYTYFWSASLGGVVPIGHSNDEDLTGLIPGTYSVTITDANLCTVTVASSAITEPAAVLSVIASPTAVACLGGASGSVSTDVSGGTSPYS